MAAFTIAKAPLGLGPVLGAAAPWGRPSCRWIVDSTAELYVDPVDPLDPVDNGEAPAADVDLVIFSGEAIYNADAPSIFPPPGEWGGASLDDLEVAVHVSLFSDRRVEAHELPLGDLDRRGWWGDSFPEAEGDAWGSRLFLLDRAKITDDPTIESGTSAGLVRERVNEALAWLVDTGAASAIEVEAERIGDGVGARIVVVRDESRDALTYDRLWGQLG